MKVSKDEILNIVAEHCIGWENCNALSKDIYELINKPKKTLKQKIIDYFCNCNK